jgi:uncharacterized protein YndB with AHSA1/START domain
MKSGFGTRVTVRVNRPAAAVYEAIASHVATNEPAWEPKVLGVRGVNGGRLRVGYRAVMTRKDYGRVRSTVFEVTALEPPNRLAVRHLDGPKRFALDWTVVPVSESATDGTATVDIELLGAMRLLTPIFALIEGAQSRRITQAMATALEGAIDPGLARNVPAA